MNNKIKVAPCACFSYDNQEGRFKIDLELPGVNNKEIKLEMRKNSFCVSAPRT